VGGDGGLVGSVRNLGEHRKSGRRPAIHRQLPSRRPALLQIGVTFVATIRELS
jgi:hypothetical protein